MARPIYRPMGAVISPTAMSKLSAVEDGKLAASQFTDSELDQAIEHLRMKASENPGWEDPVVMLAMLEKEKSKRKMLPFALVGGGALLLFLLLK